MEYLKFLVELRSLIIAQEDALRALKVQHVDALHSSTLDDIMINSQAELIRVSEKALDLARARLISAEAAAAGVNARN